MPHKKIEKTNAARQLDQAKIAYEIVPYEVDEADLAATHVAEQLQEPVAIARGISYASYRAATKSTLKPQPACRATKRSI